MEGEDAGMSAVSVLSRRKAASLAASMAAASAAAEAEGEGQMVRHALGLVDKLQRELERLRAEKEDIVRSNRELAAKTDRCAADAATLRERLANVTSAEAQSRREAELAQHRMNTQVSRLTQELSTAQEKLALEKEHMVVIEQREQQFKHIAEDKTREVDELMQLHQEQMAQLVARFKAYKRRHRKEREELEQDRIMREAKLRSTMQAAFSASSDQKNEEITRLTVMLKDQEAELKTARTSVSELRQRAMEAQAELSKRTMEMRLLQNAADRSVASELEEQGNAAKLNQALNELAVWQERATSEARAHTEAEKQRGEMQQALVKCMETNAHLEADVKTAVRERDELRAAIRALAQRHEQELHSAQVQIQHLKQAQLRSQARSQIEHQVQTDPNLRQIMGNDDNENVHDGEEEEEEEAEGTGKSYPEDAARLDEDEAAGAQKTMVHSTTSDEAAAPTPPPPPATAATTELDTALDNVYRVQRQRQDGSPPEPALAPGTAAAPPAPSTSHVDVIQSASRLVLETVDRARHRAVTLHDTSFDASPGRANADRRATGDTRGSRASTVLARSSRARTVLRHSEQHSLQELAAQDDADEAEAYNGVDDDEDDALDGVEGADEAEADMDIAQNTSVNINDAIGPVEPPRRTVNGPKRRVERDILEELGLTDLIEAAPALGHAQWAVEDGPEASLQNHELHAAEAENGRDTGSDRTRSSDGSESGNDSDSDSDSGNSSSGETTESDGRDRYYPHRRRRRTRSRDDNRRRDRGRHSGRRSRRRGASHRRGRHDKARSASRRRAPSVADDECAVSEDRTRHGRGRLNVARAAPAMQGVVMQSRFEVHEQEDDSVSTHRRANRTPPSGQGGRGKILPPRWRPGGISIFDVLDGSEDPQRGFR